MKKNNLSSSNPESYISTIAHLSNLAQHHDTYKLNGKHVTRRSRSYHSSPASSSTFGEIKLDRIFRDQLWIKPKNELQKMVWQVLTRSAI